METILIQNFKAIKNTAKREIKVANLTLLMGEQATGKSTVAKLVYFFKKLPEELMFHLVGNSEISINNFENEVASSISQLFYKIFDFSYLDNDFSVDYRYKNGLSIKIKKDDKNQELLLNWSNPDLINDIKGKWIDYYEILTPKSKEYLPIFYPDVDNSTIQLVKKIGFLFGFNQDVLYVPASRNIVVAMESQLLEIFSKLNNSNIIRGYTKNSENEYIISIYIKHTQKIKNHFRGRGFRELLFNQKIDEYVEKSANEIFIKIKNILNGEYRNTSSGEKLFYDESENYVFLENASSGQQEVIRVLQDIFLEILDNNPVFRVYEEPESHLSPVGQQGIIKLISMLANRNSENQIIIPTHTSYMLREVSNMMTASKVVKLHPELKEEVSEILKPYYWLDFESVSAYELTREGEIIDAKDAEYDMIDGELFDRVTNDISDQFDKLLKLQYAE